MLNKGQSGRSGNRLVDMRLQGNRPGDADAAGRLTREQLQLLEQRKKTPAQRAMDFVITLLPMLCCLIVPEETAQEAARVLEKYDPALHGELSADQETIDSLTQKREKEGISGLEKDQEGFTARITVERDAYVFFSVPWDKGFDARVNGEAARILKTNGMMAVPVEAGENLIRFTWRNYDLMAGFLCTAAGTVLFLVYLRQGRRRVKRQPSG